MLLCSLDNVEAQVFLKVASVISCYAKSSEVACVAPY